MMNWPLAENISAKLIDKQSYKVAFKELSPTIFANQPVFPREEFSMTDVEVSDKIRDNVKDMFELHIGIFNCEKLIGFHWGFQESMTYYMARTGLLPEYQGKGLYQKMLTSIIQHIKAKGFQSIYSKHIMTHNQVIVPKLKAGFVLSKFELSEYFGVLVHLTYYFDSKRRQMIDYRAGKRDLVSPLERELCLPGWEP